MSIKEENNNEFKSEENTETSSIEVISDKELEETVTEEEVKEEKIYTEDKIKTVKGKDSFISIVIDQVISLGVSAALLFIVDSIMRLFGYYIQNKEGMFIIFFVAVNIIYNTILHSSKKSSTFGEKLAHLKITK